MTLNDSEHMDRGGALLAAYVKQCITGTVFEIENEPVDELHDRPEEGYGTTAFRVYATDEAINTIGEHGTDALQPLGERLREEAQRAKRHVFALIGTDTNGHLRLDKLEGT